MACKGVMGRLIGEVPPSSTWLRRCADGLWDGRLKGLVDYRQQLGRERVEVDPVEQAPQQA